VRHAHTLAPYVEALAEPLILFRDALICQQNLQPSAADSYDPHRFPLAYVSSDFHHAPRESHRCANHALITEK